MKKINYIILLVAILPLVTSSCKKKGCTDSAASNYDVNAKRDDGTCTYDPHADPHITLSFEHNFDGSIFSSSNFNQLNYSNQAGNVLSVEHLEYLVSNMKLYKSNGDSLVFSDYNLFNLSDANSLSFELSNHVEEGSYTGIGFDFGFNSANNNSGSYTDLNAVNWSWPDMLGGGYHNMKLEGKFIDTNTDTISYAYHMGRAREITPTDTTFYDNHAFIKLNTSFNIENDASISIDMNIAEWFKNPNTWDLNSYNNMLMPNYTAQIMMKDNASSVFSWGGIIQ
ncbi:MAG: hypothetical protein HOJ64_00635 [Euryarchaeota archaeon]|jgi:hypothetical protein|nr:hypothetical protein [Euryarchaeota archaeon]